MQKITVFLGTVPWMLLDNGMETREQAGTKHLKNVLPILLKAGIPFGDWYLVLLQLLEKKKGVTQKIHEDRWASATFAVLNRMQLAHFQRMLNWIEQGSYILDVMPEGRWAKEGYPRSGLLGPRICCEGLWSLESLHLLWGWRSSGWGCIANGVVQRVIEPHWFSSCAPPYHWLWTISQLLWLAAGF